jgi:hypothetical protein
MKPLFLLVLISAVFLGCNRVSSPVSTTPEPLEDSAHVFVYGRDRCGLTKRMLSNLDRAGTPYTYKVIDHPGVREELRPRMKQAGLKTSGYGLPVVDVNGEIMIRPHADVVSKKYAQAWPAEQIRRLSAPTKTERDASGASHLDDPVVPCRINGYDTYTLRSQCPDYAR